METYHGHVRTPNDAIILFEACRIGILPRVQRRLSEKERQQIKSGSVFVWDEREAGMRRWTDGKSWSASRVSGSFLTYREMEGKRGNSLPTPPVKRASGKSPEGSATGDSDGEGPDGYRYKPDGLMKQSFSITTQSGQHLHLISYYSRSNSNNLPQPTNDAQLRHIRPPKNMYPESTVNETATVPAVTRGPMPGSPYSAPPHSMAGPTSPYARPGPVAPMYAVPVYPPTPPNGTPPLHYYHQPYFYPGIVYAPQPGYHPQGHVFDRPPPQISNPHAPPGHPMLVPHPAYAAHPAAQQYMAQPPARAVSVAEPAHHPPSVVPPPPPSAASRPEQGPQLPAITGAAAASTGANKPPTPEPSDKAQSQSSDLGASAASRPLPTLGSLLNGDVPDKENQSNSRSGSRSPNTVQRFPRELAAERLAKNSSAADSSALNKLNSVFVRS